MIGFTVPVEIFQDGDDDPQATALLSLDTDAVDVVGRPMLSIRVTSSDIVVSVDVQDFWNAAYEINSQMSQWQRENPDPVPSVPA